MSTPTVQIVSAKNRSCFFKGPAYDIKFHLAGLTPDVHTFVWEGCISSITAKFTTAEVPTEDVVIGIRLNYVAKSPYLVVMTIKAGQKIQTVQFSPIWYEFDFVSDTAIVTVVDMDTMRPYTNGWFYLLLVYHRKS